MHGMGRVNSSNDIVTPQSLQEAINIDLDCPLNIIAWVWRIKKNNHWAKTSYQNKCYN